VTSAATTYTDELVRTARRRFRAARPERRALLAFLISGGVTLAGIVACAVAADASPGSLVRAAVFLALYAAVASVSFEVGTGVSIPTEVVLVPMLFALPLGLVPLVTALGILVSSFARRPRALRNPLRILPPVASAAHAFGPVLVLWAWNGLPLRWSAWPVYIAALAAQFAFDFVAAAIGNLGHGVSPRELTRFVAFAYLVDAVLAPIGLVVAFATVDHWWLAVLVLPLVYLLKMLAAERKRRISSALELGDAYRGTALLLGDVIEADDEYTGSHSRHVVDLVCAVSTEMGISADDRRDAELAALLHDVGKIQIPPAVLNKPGPLDAEERALIETHTIAGERMLTKVGGLLAHVGNIVRSCHERWDGAGYPDQLAGAEIPLVARIVCVCDAYSAMTTDRPYRKAMSKPEARAEVERCAGTQFDPRVAAALLSVAG
jgi:hypothetical protein